MNTLLQKQRLLIVMIIIAALILIAGVWVIVLYDGGSRPTVTTTANTPMPTDPTTTPATTPTTQTTASETTTEKTEPVKPTGKLIALTFDDGPSASYTLQILDILERYDAKATFFVNGYQLGSSKLPVLERMIAMGCEIGNHTADHERLTGLSQAEIYQQLERVNETIFQLCGYRIRIMRPPGGHTSLSVMEAMYHSGLRLKTILWNNDSLDWSFNSDYLKGLITREEAVDKAYEMICGYPLEGAIVLMHDIKEITPDVLELLLQKLSAEGYTFVTISELFDFDSLGESAYFSKFYSQYQIVPMN